MLENVGLNNQFEARNFPELGQQSDVLDTCDVETHTRIPRRLSRQKFKQIETVGLCLRNCWQEDIEKLRQHQIGQLNTLYYKFPCYSCIKSECAVHGPWLVK